MNDRPAADDPPMPIGMFSRASLVSVKSLRRYHEQGLLVPDSVDATTGYRSYRVSQLPDAAIIERLRDLDVPLRDVAEVVRARDPAVTRAVLSRHQAAMQVRLAEVTDIVDRLHESVEYPTSHTPVHVRDEAPTHALSRFGEADESTYGDFLGDAFGRLWNAVQLTGAVMSGPSAARYPAQVEGGPDVVEAYLPIAEPVPVPQPVLDTGVTLTLVPAATCAVATHVGGYETIGESYRQLGAWVARHATSTAQPVREHYVVSVDPTTGDLLPDDQLRTEIAWPIAPTSTGATTSPTTREGTPT